MAYLNRASLIGNLGADPDLRRTSNDVLFALLSVATTETWTDRNTGERKAHTEWHRVVLYRGLAEIAESYLRKGAQVFVEGKLRTRKWTDEEGVERYLTEIVAENVSMLGKKPPGAVSAAPADAAPPPMKETPDPVARLAGDEDDIPY